MDFHFYAMLSSSLGYENSDAGHIKWSRGSQVARRFPALLYTVEPKTGCSMHAPKSNLVEGQGQFKWRSGGQLASALFE